MSTTSQPKSREPFSGWLEAMLMIWALGCLGVVGYRLAWMPTTITIADRPRDETSPPDFLTRYLDTTGTEYQIRQSFIVLPANERTCEHLRSLLASIGTYLDILHEDHASLVARQASTDSPGQPLKFDRRSAEPTADGRLAIVTRTVEWREQDWQDLDQLILSLESQYRQVAEAIKTLDSGFVVPVRFTHAEPAHSSGRQLAEATSDSPVTEQIELIDIPISHPALPANQGRALGN